MSELLEALEPVRPALSRFSGDCLLPERTLVLAGPRPWQAPPTEGEAILRFCREHGIPLLADGSNPLRYRADGATPVIIHYDRMLRDDDRWEDLKPEAVVLWESRRQAKSSAIASRKWTYVVIRRGTVSEE